MPINTHLIFSLKAECSKSLREWINVHSSLTDKLRKVRGEAQVSLLSQAWIPTDLWSKNLLSIEDKSIFQREILMKSHNEIYWYARSLIPQKCYDCDPAFFDRLQNESIKNLIFNEERVQRINSINYPVDKQCVEYYWVKKYLAAVEGILWVRIAEYCFAQQESFYVIEVLLPILGEHC